MANYTTAEQALHQNWIDGSKLFRKVIDLGSLPSHGAKFVAHGIVNLGLVVRMAGRAYDGVNHIPLPHVHRSDSNKGVPLQVDEVNVRLDAGIDRSSFEGTVVLIYTKAE